MVKIFVNRLKKFFVDRFLWKSPEKKFFEDLFFWRSPEKNFKDLFLEYTCVCVLGPWPWPRAFLSLGLESVCLRQGLREGRAGGE